MSLESIILKVASINEGQECIVTFQSNTSQTRRLKCLFGKLEGNNLSVELSFPEKFDILVGENVLFSTAPSLGLPTISCNTELKDISNQIITLKVSGELDPASLRESFRVNYRIPISAEHGSGASETSAKPVTTTGETIDISKSGLLAILVTEVPSDEDLKITLELPDPAGIATCTARIIRIRRLTRKKWLTSMHFTDIEDKDADLIVGNCLQEQRRQIRENVKLD